MRVMSPDANRQHPAEPPWASGPGEILRHGLSLLSEDSDANRRLAFLSIDNAVELTMQTYLGLPRRVTGLSVTRREVQQMTESFPAMLDALEEHAADKLRGLQLGEIEWYHRLRNQLYHQGNGLTVEMAKVQVYGELARLLFKSLSADETPKTDSKPFTMLSRRAELSCSSGTRLVRCSGWLLLSPGRAAGTSRRMRSPRCSGSRLAPYSTGCIGATLEAKGWVGTNLEDGIT